MERGALGKHVKRVRRSAYVSCSDGTRDSVQHSMKTVIWACPLLSEGLFDTEKPLLFSMKKNLKVPLIVITGSGMITPEPALHL